MLLLPLILGWNRRRGRWNDLPPNPLLNPPGGCNRYSQSACRFPKDRLLETSVASFRNFSALVLLVVEGANHVQSWLVRASSIVQGRKGTVWWLRWWRICPECRRSRVDPWVWKIPWRRDWLPTCLENPMDRGAWKATVHGVARSQTPLSKQHFHFLFAEHISLTLKMHSSIQ